MADLKDKIRGSLFAGAVGDALGYAVEFKQENYIFSKYGKDGITSYEYRNGKAIISDDTQMTLFTANGILADSAGDPYSNARNGIELAYFDWLTTQYYNFKESRKIQKHISWLFDVPGLFSPRAPGNTCLNALEYRISHEKVEDFIADKINNSCGCGGIMRVAPVGLKHPDAPIENIVTEAAESAAITHSHPLGYLPAAVLADIVHRIVFPKEELSLKEIVLKAKNDLCEVFPDEEGLDYLCEQIDLAISLSENDKTDLENIHELGQGWVAQETLTIALYCCLKYQNDISKAIIVSVNHKGDSDSTGAVTGNILGALTGYDAIEEKWKKDLELSDLILEIADDMYILCTGQQNEEWEQKYVFHNAPEKYASEC